MRFVSFLQSSVVTVCRLHRTAAGRRASDPISTDMTYECVFMIEFAGKMFLADYFSIITVTRQALKLAQHSAAAAQSRLLLSRSVIRVKERGGKKP